MKHYIVIDIGGTAIKYGLLTENEEFETTGEMPTEAAGGGPVILDKVRQIVSGFLKGKQDRVGGVCISTAGMVDTEKGEIFYAAPLIPKYAGTNFKDTISQEFHLPCEVENDVNCAGLAEAVSGAGKGSDSVFCLTIGTGIGGCVILHGKVWHGASQSAGEVGYMHLRGSDFQTLGAASILSRTVAQKKGDDLSAWDGKRIFEAARAGDAVCRRAIEDMCDVLGEGIANICFVLNPQIIVLGGGIMAQKEYLSPLLNKALDKYLVSSMRKKTELAFARHGNRAGMLGAYYHFRMCQNRK